MLPYNRKSMSEAILGAEENWDGRKRPIAIKNHSALEITLSRTQETRLCPKNLPPGSHNFHQSAKKSCKEELSTQAACAGAETESSKGIHRPRRPAGGGYRVRGAGSGTLWGLGVRGRPRAVRARCPRPHPSPRPRAVGGETRVKEKTDNAGPGW